MVVESWVGGEVCFIVAKAGSLTWSTLLLVSGMRGEGIGLRALHGDLPRLGGSSPLATGDGSWDTA